MKDDFRIYWHKRLKKFMVNIWYQHQNLHIGYYETREEAVLARDNAFNDLYGPEGLKIAYAAHLNRKDKRKANRFEQIKTMLKKEKKRTKVERKPKTAEEMKKLI